ncbi:MAG: hypothetical protein SOH58_03035 [Olsenella sp.]|jgi:hypothetical protein
MNDLQNELAGATVALGATITAAMDDVPGFVPCGTPSQVVTGALVATGADEAPADLAARVQQVHGFVDHVADHRGVEPHADTDVTALSPAGRQLLEALLGFSASADADGVTPDEAEWLYRSLAAVESGDDERSNAQLAATPRR